MSLNQKYLKLLAKNPLLTKSLTALTLAFLNEQIASLISKDLNYYHKWVPLNNKTILMLIYGGAVNAPLSHYFYKLLNLVVKPVGLKKKTLQLLIQLVTILPLLTSIMIGYISLINNAKIAEIPHNIRANLPKLLKSGWLLNIFNLVVAQNFLPPELWVVFFNFNFFVLGTYQNTLLKLRLKEEIKEKEE